MCAASFHGVCPRGPAGSDAWRPVKLSDPCGSKRSNRFFKLQNQTPAFFVVGASFSFALRASTMLAISLKTTEKGGGLPRTTLVPHLSLPAPRSGTKHAHQLTLHSYTSTHSTQFPGSPGA